MKPVATVGSMHTCPMCSGTTPHVGGPITQGEANVLINGKPVATMGSMCTCVGPPDTIVQGNPTVLINGKPIACVGDMTAHGGTITVGSPNVFVGSGASTPTTIMPIKKIPFPKFNFPNRILASTVGQAKNLKKAKENQDKLKDIEKQEEPRVYNPRWIREERIIRNSKVLKQVVLKASVINIADGETATLKIRKPKIVIDENGNEQIEESEVVTLSGTVQDKEVEFTWEVEDETHQHQQ